MSILSKHNVKDNVLYKLNAKLPSLSQTDPSKTFFLKKLRSNTKSRVASVTNNTPQSYFPLIQSRNNCKNIMACTQNQEVRIRKMRTKRLRKINRLLNLMRNMPSSNRNKSFTNTSINIKIISDTPNYIKDKELSKDKKKLKKLIDNDSSYIIENIASVKQNLILGSMRTTFLCSNYCRFQPLLNIFE